jgi:hypothetical protein
MFVYKHTDIHKYRHMRNIYIYIYINDFCFIYSCKQIYAYLDVYVYIHSYLYESNTCTAKGLAVVTVHPVSIIALKGKASENKMNIKYMYVHISIFRHIYMHAYV